MPGLVKKQNISLDLAQKMVDTAVAKAKEICVSKNVVIVDDCARAALALVSDALAGGTKS